MHKYDDAEIYFLNFPRGLPNEAGGIPIGLYLCWAAEAGLVPDALKREIDGHRGRGQSPAELLFDLTDGKLTRDEFNEEGQAFSEDYYGQHYIADYRRCFRLGDDCVDTLCSVADSVASLQRLKPYLNERLIHWRATPRKAPEAKATPMKARELYAWLQEHLAPELRADGFEDLKPRANEFEVRRRLGQIEQVLLFMVYDGNGSTQASFRFYLGAERLREAGRALIDTPPACFAAPVRVAADVEGTEFHLADGMQSLAPYYERIAERGAQLGEIRLAHYREWVRPTLNGLDSIAKLAGFIQSRGQRIQLRNNIGMSAPQLTARVLLLSAYGDHLRGPEGDELLFQLRQHIRRPLSAYADRLLSREQLDALIERVQQPGCVDRLRADFDAA